MPAYLIVYREGPVRDEAEMAEYQRKTRAMQVDVPVKPVVVYGAVHPVEGEPPEGVIMLEFPTVEAAKAWYGSPGYQDALPHRKRAAEYRAIIVEGL
jgi:uncharacterized protein (DUF1330 family)